jgi:hypothetical protein
MSEEEIDWKAKCKEQEKLLFSMEWEVKESREKTQQLTERNRELEKRILELEGKL